MSVVESQHASHDGHRPSDPAAGAAGRAGAGPSPRGSAERRRAPLALAATVTTVWAGLVSLAPTIAVVFVVYAADSADASIAPVARLVLAGWLLAHGVPVHTELGPIGLAPLAITAFAAWRVMRAGVHTARALKARRSRSPWRTLAAGVGVGFVYGLLGAATAAAAKLPSMSVSVPRAWITLTVFGIVTGVVGAAVESGLLDRAAQAAPGLVRDAVRTGAVAALLVFGAGAAAAGMAVALAGGEASQVLADYGTGVVGQAG
ncbi:MAG: hypothetical protein HKP61_05540, partial [Dactylosporangium sp.]|nr:hypothetical protein [Dactylosporangium sp.]